MTDCCSPETGSGPLKKRICPDCRQLSGRVSTTTISHHLKAPWRWQETHGDYHFCETPTCDVVYFGEESWVAKSHDVRTLIGLKNPSDQAARLCYCFGISKAEAAQNPAAKAYVIKKTGEQVCACKIRNPSGRCCLKDFPE